MKTAASPWVVLLVAASLPGMGQVLNNQPKRGLVLVFYVLLLGLLTSMVADQDASFVGRFAGGIFVWALSAMDAYRVAVVRRQLAPPSRASAP